MVSAPLKDFSRELPWADEGDLVARRGDKVYIKHLDGPLFFGFANRFQELMSRFPDLEVVVLRFDKVPYMDQSGLYALEDAVMYLNENNIRVRFTDIHGQPRDLAERIRLIPDVVAPEYCFPTFAEAATWLERYLAGDTSDPVSRDSDADDGASAVADAGLVGV